MPVPASQLVSVVPSVLSAGGAQLQLNGLVLTSNTRVPIGQVLSFASAAAVSAYFGAASTEAAMAATYFGGFNGCTQFPVAMLFAQFPWNNFNVPVGVLPYLRGGSLSSMTLATLQTLSGSLTVSVNGTTRTANSINLAGATSFSNAAASIQTAFGPSYDAVATATIAQQTAAFTGSIAAGVLTVTNMINGTISIGSVLSGTSGAMNNIVVTGQLTGTGGQVGTYSVNSSLTVASQNGTASYGVLNISALNSGGPVAIGQGLGGTFSSIATYGTISITALGSGTGGTGTYILSGGTASGTMSSSSVNLGQLTITFDSVSSAFLITGGTPGTVGTIAPAGGTLATQLALTTAAGAVTSQGAAQGVPGTFMTALVMGTAPFSVGSQNWATFATTFNPDVGAGINTNKLLFAAWNSSTIVGAARFAYVTGDPDASPTTGSAPACFMAQVTAAQYQGIVGISDTVNAWPSPFQTFVQGMVAATNFNAANGRITHAYKGLTGLTPTVTSQSVYTNLVANGYNCYAQFATANQLYNEYQPGQISGPFAWSDSYVNQIWLNQGLQADLMNFLANINSVPYNSAGYAMVEAVIAGRAALGVNNGVISPGVPLSAAQIVEANQQAGTKIDGILSSRGWYAQVQAATATVRAARTSPPCNFWYMDGGSIQQITLASIEAQ